MSRAASKGRQPTRLQYAALRILCAGGDAYHHTSIMRSLVDLGWASRSCGRYKVTAAGEAALQRGAVLHEEAWLRTQQMLAALRNPKE